MPSVRRDTRVIAATISPPNDRSAPPRSPHHRRLATPRRAASRGARLKCLSLRATALTHAAAAPEGTASPTSSRCHSRAASRYSSPSSPPQPCSPVATAARRRSPPAGPARRRGGPASRHLLGAAASARRLAGAAGAGGAVLAGASGERQRRAPRRPPVGSRARREARRPCHRRRRHRYLVSIQRSLNRTENRCLELSVIPFLGSGSPGHHSSTPLLQELKLLIPTSAFSSTPRSSCSRKPSHC